MTALEQVLTGALDSGLVPGAVGVLARGAAVETVAVGELAEDAIVRIQSMTKPITAVAALRLVEQGRITLDDSVEPWLPELADRRVLRTPEAALDDTVPAERSITLRDLITNMSGYGMIFTDSPLQAAMATNLTGAGPDPVGLGADDWLARLAELPLVGQPGKVWRYHHSFGVLGILLQRLVRRPLVEHLDQDLFGPLGMVDTAFTVPRSQAHRFPAAYRNVDGKLIQTDPAADGFYLDPPFDVCHAELVSTAADYLRFARALQSGALLSPEHVAAQQRDQIPPVAKSPDAFFPGFWDEESWGFGVGLHVGGDHRGRYGWTGGAGTHMFIDPDGLIAILLTQVEMDAAMTPLLAAVEGLTGPGC